MVLSTLVACALLGAVASAGDLDSTVQPKGTKAPLPSTGPPALLASEDSICKSKKTCEACLAVGSGCKGWQGDSCCSEQECENAANGDKNFFVSCENFKKYDELKEVCMSKKFEDDACACINAGCVYQDPGGCAATYNPAAGQAVDKTTCSEPASDLVAQFCPDSPEQRCKRKCPPTECPLPTQCAMRIGNCCAIACMPKKVST